MSEQQAQTPAPAAAEGKLTLLLAPSWPPGDDGTARVPSAPGSPPAPPLAWFSPSPVHARCETGGVLSVSPAGKTDYWSNTFYGFPDPQPHTGPFLFAEVEGDFVCEVDRVRAEGRHRYDQAGLMVVVPAGGQGCWLKTSVEFIPDGPSHLGSVVTNLGYSDWATQDVEVGPAAAATAAAGEGEKAEEPGGAGGVSEYAFRIRRLGADYIVEARKAASAAPWSQLRMAHLHADTGKGEAVRVGLYACSPIEAGFTARFEGFRIWRGRV